MEKTTKQKADELIENIWKCFATYPTPFIMKCATEIAISCQEREVGLITYLARQMAGISYNAINISKLTEAQELLTELKSRL